MAKFTCPNCGAEIRVSNDTVETTCESCLTVVNIKPVDYSGAGFSRVEKPKEPLTPAKIRWIVALGICVVIHFLLNFFLVKSIKAEMTERVFIIFISDVLFALISMITLVVKEPTTKGFDKIYYFIALPILYFIAFWLAFMIA